MNTRLARLLVRLYPSEWRDRYGAEFEELLCSGRGDAATLLNVVAAAIREHLAPQTQPEHLGVSYVGSVLALARRPSAYVPMVMSLIALVLLLICLLLMANGVMAMNHEDEGFAAHLWQLLMAGQLPMLGYFVLRWFPRRPLQTLCVLGAQLIAATMSLFPVFYFQL